jgi:hypothetical protein
VKFAGSVEYDNYKGEWCDILVEAPTMTSFEYQLKTLLKIKRNSSIFFATKIIGERQIDITQQMQDALKSNI